MLDGQDPIDLHDPAARAVIDALMTAGVLPVSASSVQQARQVTDELSAAGASAMPTPLSIMIPNEIDMECLIVRPDGPARGLIVYFHGGGWVVGSPHNYLPLANCLARQSDCIVILPHYRLAPEAPFPAAVRDALAAVEWAAGNDCARIVGARLPLIVAGDSAGGNLAAVAVQHLASDIAITAQLLFYPVVDSDFSRPSYRQFAEGSMLSAADMQWFWDHYSPNVEERASPMASPLRARSLARLPSAIIVTAQIDPLVDEGREYAERLAAEGVSVTYREIAGMPHGFLNLIDVLPVANAAIEFVAEELKSRLTN